MNVVEMRSIYKHFGNFCANENVDFTLREGEIHALLGENGAGKSTLMNILYGLYSCDSGTISIMGEPVCIDCPNVAITKGIGMVHQHFMLIPQLTVTQNIFLGMKSAGFVLNMKQLNERVRELNDRFGFNVDPSALIWQIPVGVQQKVEILKVLMRDARILILDEPSAVLTPNEVVELFASLKKLSQQGYSIILITHKMSEVTNYADRVTVMRQGKMVSTLNVCDTDQNELARMMVGRDVCLDRQVEGESFGSPLLEVKNLVVKNNKGLNAVKGVSFEVREGEILGIAGVDGNGQLELSEAVVGLRKTEAGEICISGERAENKSIRFLLDKGMAHIPDDRHKKGLVLKFPIKENIIMGMQRSKRYTKGMFLNRSAVEAHAQELVREFDVRPADIDYEAGGLSGGNQQKVILAREVDRNPSILVALQPTRGLDIGATEFVRSKLLEERTKKKAVLLVSTDLDEIVSLSDRILVIHNGEFMGEVRHDTPATLIGLMMAGKTREQAEAAGKECNA